MSLLDFKQLLLGVGTVKQILKATLQRLYELFFPLRKLEYKDNSFTTNKDNVFPLKTWLSVG